MCGIAGELVFNGAAPPSPELWQAIVDRMRRRGPDDGGIWRDEETCVLGCRRLSIMDPLARARLPMTMSKGRFALVFNGELYDFRDLASELQGRGHKFHTSGDSEVVLAALIEYGPNALTRFNGMFALAFYDLDARTLLLARDHAGMKPLYVARHSDGLLFCSELDLLLLHPRTVRNGVDPGAAAMYLRLGYVPAPRSYFRDTATLEPGSWLTIDASGREASGRFFRLPACVSKRLKGAEADEAVEAAIRRAVRRQLVSDVPVGSFLSGGIDSPLIAVLASEAAGSIDTFTTCVRDRQLDESRDAARYAEHIRSRHHTVEATDDDALDMIEDVISATCEPLADEGMYPSLSVASLARQHVGVVLSGDGADELFFGYVRRHAAMMEASLGTSLTERFVPFFNDFAKEEFAACFRNIPWWPPAEPLYRSSPDDESDPMEWVRWAEFTAYLPFILMKTDRASMFHSLEVRLPFLDREVIQTALSIDPTDCITQDGLGKRPLRAALSRLTAMGTREKRGFTIPIDKWISGPLRELAEESLARLAGLEVLDVDRRAVKRLFENHVGGRKLAGLAIWRLVILDLWITKKVRNSLRPIRVGAPVI